MIYISKGIVQEKSTERNIYVGRGGQVFQLTKIEAQLWLDAGLGSTQPRMPLKSELSSTFTEWVW